MSTTINQDVIKAREVVAGYKIKTFMTFRQIGIDNFNRKYKNPEWKAEEKLRNRIKYHKARSCKNTKVDDNFFVIHKYTERCPEQKQNIQNENKSRFN